jgi:hypothetical protein
MPLCVNFNDEPSDVLSPNDLWQYRLGFVFFSPFGTMKDVGELFSTTEKHSTGSPAYIQYTAVLRFIDTVRTGARSFVSGPYEAPRESNR